MPLFRRTAAPLDVTSSCAPPLTARFFFDWLFCMSLWPYTSVLPVSPPRLAPLCKSSPGHLIVRCKIGRSRWLLNSTSRLESQRDAAFKREKTPALCTSAWCIRLRCACTAALHSCVSRAAGYAQRHPAVRLAALLSRASGRSANPHATPNSP